MKNSDEIKKDLKDRLLILDGATGTQLQARGMPEGVCPELWCCEHPEVIGAIHRAYADAGADIVYACTFGANRCKLAEHGSDDVEGVNERLVRVAREAVDGTALVAGDIAPTGRFVAPFGDVPFEEAVEVYKEQVRGLIKGGVDLFVIETMMDIQEARAALIAVRELSDAFCMVTMTYEPGGRTLNGTDPLSALVTLQALGADAVGCNCSTGPDGMLELIKIMQPYATVPLVAKPNAGLPHLENGRTVFDMDAPEFASFASQFAEAGVGLMGGCCGTTPDHIHDLAAALKDTAPQPPARKTLSALSSARKTVALDAGAPLFVIGERINPTGKKQLQEELKNGSWGTVRRFAREQEAAGAAILDVNVGMAGIDEKQTSNACVDFLAVQSDLPLSIDSSDPAVIESSLRRYPGRALINSISGEPGKMEQLAPVAAKYGAMFILLPLTGSSVPKTAVERAAIVEELFAQAAPHGIVKDDLIVDALVMTVSADQAAARQTLETIRWVSEEFGARTAGGLSNVSFGLPERRWINSAFVAMCIQQGMSLAIANPGSEELMAVKHAADVLTGRDRESKEYVTRYSNAGAKPAAKKPADLQPGEAVYNAILEGNREEIGGLLDKALDSGLSPSTLVDDHMVPAINEVGARYDKKTYFLPQLIASAETMKRGFEHMQPRMKESGDETRSKGRIVFATVQGDIHDIGKNIVILMLRNHGFEVIDLGKDVKHKALLEAIETSQPDIVGLSALMTTTMTNMEDAVNLARDAGATCRFMVGGAVVSEDFAQGIGAHYSKDGVDACRLADSLMDQIRKDK